MKLIASATVSGSASDIQFTNIPQTFTDLYVVISAKGRTSSGVGALVIYTVDGQSSSLSTWRDLRSTGSGIENNGSAYPIVGNVQHVSDATFGSISVHIPNYKASTQKAIISDSVTENNATTAYINMNILRINYTDPISFLGFGDGSYGGGFAVGSTVSVYGIKNGSGGATVS